MNIDRTIDIFSSRFEIESFLVPLVGLLVIFMSFSCTREKPSTTKIKLELPQYIASTSSAYSKALKNKVGVQSNDDWGLADPTSISEVACYALFVGGPGLDLNSCKNSAGVEVVRFGRQAGIFKPGDSIELEVPSGKSRQINLVGFATDDTTSFQYCRNIFGTSEGPAKAHFSTPMIIARTTLDLAPGSAEVNLMASLNGAEKFSDCSFFSSGGGAGDGGSGGDGGGSSENLFGDGGDGDIVIGPESMSIARSYSLGSYTGYTAGSRSLASTKFLSASRRVTSIDSTGRVLTLNSTVTSDEFQVGDEIMLHVVAGRYTGFGGDAACGGGLYRGLYDFFHVNAASSSTLTVDRQVGDDPLGILNTHLAAGISFSGDFCHVQVVRVPNLNSLSIQAANTHELQSGSYDWQDNSGLLVLRVKEIFLDTGSTLTLSANGSGFNTTAYSDGGGLSGPGGVTGAFVENGAGFTSSAYGAGGGGSAVAVGGDGGGGGASNTGGNEIDYCGGIPCSIVGGHKIIYGGAGGGANTVTGGFGGGGVFIMVGKIYGNGTLNLRARGDVGSGTQAGGGAGGTVHLTARDLDASVVVSADGASGNSGGGSGGGGGGAGGVSEINYCQSQSNTTSAMLYASATVLGGAGGPSSTPDGLVGEDGLILVNDSTAVCSAY